MPTYAYTAVSNDGRKSRGFEHAASAGALSRTLEDRGLLVLEVADAPADAATGGGRFKFGLRREVLEVTRAMAALLPAGMPLAQSLNAATGVATGEVRTVLQEVRARVERGETLSHALEAYPRLFAPMYVGVVRAGERSGDLDSAFTRLATQLERDEQLRGRVLSASIYPLLLATAGTIAITVLLFFVLPRFVGLLAGTGAALPRSTRLLLGVSSLLHRFWYLLILAPAAIGAIITWLLQTTEGRLTGARALLTIPFVKTLRRYALAARFSRLVGVLLGGGAPLLTALDDTIESMGDPVARADVERIRTVVREGTSLRAAVAASPIFPVLLSQLIGVGEDAGRLREFLLKSADIFEERTERATQRLATLAEPVMIVVFGAVVATIALSLLQAIYGINATSFKLMRVRRGFTLWEMAVVLALTALAAALVIPAWSDLGQTSAAIPGDALVALLRDARRLAIDQSQTVAVRVDPSTLYYRVDTTGASGTGPYFEGALAVGTYESFVTDLPRLQFVFRPTGMALGDTVVVRGDLSVLVAVDTWSGEVVRYAR